ncbi:MAG: alpha/beta hydrolase [Proteobacteria bacterium]|nr:alpha/beta hydrolase [Pseudomonadota bacterium]
MKSFLSLFYLILILVGFYGIFNKVESKHSETQKITLFSEAFGNKNHPAILLNAGAGSQSIVWADVFCKKLAEKRYFVIRYDYRDTGLSSQVQDEITPYTIHDLAKDALNILKKYHIQKGHIVGFSMGGQIAQFLGAYYPDHVLSLILIGTSTDFKPGFDAFEGKFKNEGLSPPNQNYVTWATRQVDLDAQTLDEKVEDYIKTWRYLDGNSPRFNKDYYRNEGIRNYTRTKLHKPYLKHARAMKSSFKDHKKAPSLIKSPTLILQGAQDPVFGIDHGKKLNSQIKNSTLLIWDDFAHAISPQNFDRIIEEIDRFIKSHF